MQVLTVEIKKQGQTAKGKAWTMYQIVVEDGRTASGFDQVHVGDNVDLFPSQDGKYLNYSKADKPENVNTPQNMPAFTQISPVARSNGLGGMDQRQNRIERQHSQEMALRYFNLGEGVIPTTNQLRGMISWFQRDISHSPEIEEIPNENNKS